MAGNRRQVHRLAPAASGGYVPRSLNEAATPEGATTATITSTSQLFRPVSSGSVRAAAVPLHRGRTTVTAQTSLYDPAERLVAQTTQIQAVRPAAG